MTEMQETHLLLTFFRWMMDLDCKRRESCESTGEAQSNEQHPWKNASATLIALLLGHIPEIHRALPRPGTCTARRWLKAWKNKPLISFREIC